MNFMKSFRSHFAESNMEMIAIDIYQIKFEWPFCGFICQQSKLTLNSFQQNLLTAGDFNETFEKFAFR